MSRNGQIGVLVAAAALALSAGCATTAAHTAAGRWYEIRSPRFQAWTDGDPEQGRRLVVDLERFHQVMLAKTTAEEREAAPPLRIFLAKNHSSYVAWTGNRQSAGVFGSSVRGNYALVTAWRGGGKWTQDSRHVLFHEYTHYMMAAQGANVPSWYNEGFAEYMSATRFREDGSYTLGCPLRYRAQSLAHLSWVPMRRVMEAQSIASGSPDSPFLEREAAAAYVQSWYAVHFFSAESERQQQLGEFLERWSAQTAAPEEIAQGAFKLTYGELDALLQQYTKRTNLACVDIRPARPLEVPNVEVRPLSRAEAHYHVGDMMLAWPGRTETAFELLREAAALQPKDHKISAALARAHYVTALRTQGDAAANALQEAERMLALAKPGGAADPEVLTIEGHVLRLKAERLSATQDASAADVLARARAAYRQAIRTDETMAEAYYGLGATYLIADNGSKEPQVVLEAAAYLLPLDTEIAWTLAQLHIARGNALQAVAALEHILRWSKDLAVRARVIAALNRLRVQADAPEDASAAPAEPAAP